MCCLSHSFLSHLLSINMSIDVFSHERRSVDTLGNALSRVPSNSSGHLNNTSNSSYSNLLLLDMKISEYSSLPMNSGEFLDTTGDARNNFF